MENCARAWYARAAMSVRVRFSPSPSGYLHIGGARTALFNWLWAKQQGGAFVLRIEDSDQERSSPESVAAVLSALRWLGLDWDEGPEVGGPHAPYFQSERRALYREVCEELIAKDHAYRCTCTKEELAQARDEALRKNPKQPFRYPGTCREAHRDPGLPHVVRFKVPATGTTHFVDKVFGLISTPNEAQYDFVLLRANGFPLYNLACAVDDHVMEISLVARGRDHLGNTPQQVMLYQALGWKLPEFAHLPLMLSQKGEKLSKRHAAVAVQDYRDRGYTPQGVLNNLARFGWSHGDQEIFTRDQLIELFSWDNIGKADGKFDENKFADVAFEHLKEPDLLSLDDYAELVVPFLLQRGISDPDRAVVRAALQAVRLRARSLADAAEALDYYFREPPEMDPKARAKFLVPDAVPMLQSLLQLLATSSTWEAQTLEERVKAFSEEQQLKMKAIAQPARVALTGRMASPGLFEVMEVLGREKSLQRLQSGIELAVSSG
jgi:glutamyl-tRNA synthetase